MYKKTIILSILIILFIVGESFGQNNTDEKERFQRQTVQESVLHDATLYNTGDLSFRRFVRWAKHTGNLVESPFVNNGNVSDGYWGPSQRQRWPIGSGTVYGHTFSFYVAAEVELANGTLRPIVSSSYNRGGGDSHPSGSHKYFFNPIPGYFNMNPQHNNSLDREHLQNAGKYYVGGLRVDTNGDGVPDTELENRFEYPAMSHLPETWPEFWPPGSYVGDLRGPNEFVPGVRAGRWNGQFGSFVRADQESYYVMDDRDNDKHAYYPFNLPDGTPDTRPWNQGGRRGLGVEVTARQYQWNNVLAEDILISTFDVVNVSEKDIETAIVGMLVDFDIGNRTSDNRAFYDVLEDITYQWHSEGLSNRGLPTGYAAVAFLQSPGNPFDGIDNDLDGMIDESQENGIDDDEDWVVWEDVSGSGFFEPGIDLIWDDVGSDGLGPDDEDYPGPDPDGTEANGRPDLGEPNFEFTDNDEIDQIGLTSVYISFPTNIQNDLWNGTAIWRDQLTPGTFVVPEETSDIMYVYGSGYTGLEKNRRERFAIASVLGNDFPDVLRNKRTMRNIYDSDYTFAKAPNRPFLTAVPGDREVTLIWDNNSERSRDPVYGNDFHSYRIYRSTEASFDDIKTITDAFGNPLLWKHVAQFDKKNGLTGAHPIPIGETGISYDMGSDTGLQYAFVDKGLTNGRTYYYAIVALDTGYDIDFFERGISRIQNLNTITPTETSKVIQVDPLGRPVFIDRNTAVVVPQEYALGYKPPGLSDGVQQISGNGTGDISISLLNPSDMKPNTTYSIKFADDNSYQNLDNAFETGNTTGMVLTNTLTGDTLLVTDADFNSELLKSSFVDGFLVKVENISRPKVAVQEWRRNNQRSNSGRTPALNVTIQGDTPNTNAVPFDFEIRFSEVGVDTSFSLIPSRRIPTNFQVFDVTDRNMPKRIPFTMLVPDNDLTPGLLKDGYAIELKAGPVTVGNNIIYTNTTWRLVFSSQIENPENLPEDQRKLLLSTQSGDLFYFDTDKPFDRNDVFEFTIVGNEIELEDSKAMLENIYVVPDPYIAASSLEPRLRDQGGRGERRIDFVNLPTECRIRIFTTSGRLVKEINHFSVSNEGRASWNMLTNEGLEVSFGVYIYHVDAPGIGEKIGRFAIIK